MTSKEAYVLVLKKLPDKKAIECREYTNIFTFVMVSKDFDESKSTFGMLLRPWMVDKSTKEVRVLNPMKDLSAKEMKQYIEIFDYK